jgi:hypothetical protein
MLVMPHHCDADCAMAHADTTYASHPKYHWPQSWLLLQSLLQQLNASPSPKPMSRHRPHDWLLPNPSGKGSP